MKLALFGDPGTRGNSEQWCGERTRQPSQRCQSPPSHSRCLYVCDAQQARHLRGHPTCLVPSSGHKTGIVMHSGGGDAVMVVTWFDTVCMNIRQSWKYSDKFVILSSRRWTSDPECRFVWEITSGYVSVFNDGFTVNTDHTSVYCGFCTFSSKMDFGP